MEKSYHVTGKALSWLKSIFLKESSGLLSTASVQRGPQYRQGRQKEDFCPFCLHVNDLPDVVRSDSILFADDFKLYARIDS